jgi:tetratricopeptide (TPR) repeat protein
MADAEALFELALAAAARIDDAELRGRGHLARGQARDTTFRLAEALADYTQAVGLGREIGDRRLEMAALHELGGPAWTGAGRPVDAGIGHIREGLRLAEQLGDRGAEARLLSWLAILDCNQLRFAEAYEHGRRADEAARASGDEAALIAALDGRKTAYAYLGEVGQLTAVLDELEPRVRRTGNLRLLQWCVFESAFPHVAAGRWDTADRLVGDALAISARGGYTGYAAWYVAHRGWIARLAGRTRDALALGKQAVEMDSHAWFVAAVSSMYATTLLTAGAPDRAIPLLERGLEVCGTHRTAAYRLRCLAPLAEATGSRTLLTEADDAVSSISLPPDSAWLYGADVYFSVARAWRAQGEPGRAATLLEPLLAASRRTGWVAPLAAYSNSVSSAAARRAPSVSTAR